MDHNNLPSNFWKYCNNYFEHYRFLYYCWNKTWVYFGNQTGGIPRVRRTCRSNSSNTPLISYLLTLSGSNGVTATTRLIIDFISNKLLTSRRFPIPSKLLLLKQHEPMNKQQSKNAILSMIVGKCSVFIRINDTGDICLSDLSDCNILNLKALHSTVSFHVTRASSCQRCVYSNVTLCNHQRQSCFFLP